jgi:small subunit ribosomal protein S10
LDLEGELARIRLPKAIQATYLAPLRRDATKPPSRATTVCQLSLRSYNVRNLEVFADFALRAAYFLKLPTKGTTSLPRKTERWTVPRGPFVHKKSQENFERITLGRRIEIYEGHPDVVATWLAFLRKHQYYGVGMKANVWEYGSLDAPAEMDREAEKIARLTGDISLTTLLPGKTKGEHLQQLLIDEPFKAARGAYTPSGGATSVPHGSQRIAKSYVRDTGVHKKASSRPRA